MRRFFIIIVLSFLIYIFGSFKLVPAEENYSAAEIQLALKKLNVLGSALYIAAHPDDENTALLAYLSKEKLVRTGYLSLTRGDGGQNLIGTESNVSLGIMRTQELLSARKIDGAEQFFSRAIDFGYSKNPEETLSIWDKEKILSDVVWIIRKFRPDLIITRFTPEMGGHGHHRASAILAIEAFEAAGDPNRFPEQLKYVDTWQPKRVLWNTWRPGLSSSGTNASPLPHLDLGTYNTLLGKSYGEISAKSRSMHKTQGFGASIRRGSYMEYFSHLAGDSAVEDIFEDINLTWTKIMGGTKIEKKINQIYGEFNPENPAGIIPELIQLYKELGKLDQNFWTNIKRKEISDIIKSSAGLWFEATAGTEKVYPGMNLDIQATALNRSNYPLELEKLSLSFKNSDTLIQKYLNNNQPLTVNTRVKIPENVSVSQPYWLKEEPLKGSFNVEDQQLIGLAENPYDLYATFTFRFEDLDLDHTVPIIHKVTDPVAGEIISLAKIVPPVFINFKQEAYIFPNNQEKTIQVVLQNQSNQTSGKLFIDVSNSWYIEPKVKNFDFSDKDEQKIFAFNIQPPNETETVSLKASIEVNNKKYAYQINTVDYEHISKQIFMPAAKVKLVKVDLQDTNKKIGYIMGSGDNTADALEQIGYQVTLLNEQDIPELNLNQFDAIIIGIRAYNTNQWLNHQNKSLLDYVYNGGTLVVQYNVNRGLVADQLGPYPFQISRDRVSVEESPVEFLQPSHPILSYPHQISQKDFSGWVQERGLYFTSEWDPQYQAILSSCDPGEEKKKGGLLVTQYGKGKYIYTGYSFFRQLPAGVPGAYRLFVNIISAGGTFEK
jgi:LmbE family N-acetylglucosaminyl deacetylase